MTTDIPNTQQSMQPTNNDEIDLIALIKEMWNGRRTIRTYTLAGVLIGLLFALLSPKEYTVSTTMVPQTSQNASSQLGGLSSLAAMAGFNVDMNSSSDALSPLVYPQIVQSVPFQVELINTPFKLAEVNHPISLYDYYTEYQKSGVLANVKKYTLGLPGVIIKALKGAPDSNRIQSQDSTLISLSREQENVLKIMNEKVTLEINDKEGVITLSTRFHDPVLAAQVAHKAQVMLQTYVSTYRIQKAQDQLNYINARYQEKKDEFEGAQEKLARFRDQNRNVSSAMAQTEEERLDSEYNIAFSVYSELAKQLEQAQLKVKEDTPILTTLEPVRIPLEKSSPNRPLILIIWTFLGVIAGVGIVFSRQFLASIKERWQTE